MKEENNRQSGLTFFATAAAVLSLSCGSLEAATYTISVPAGETSDLKSEMDRIGKVLAAGDTIIKNGNGDLEDASTAYEGTEPSSLVFDIREGAFVETVARMGCNYKVTSGATLVERVAIRGGNYISKYNHFYLEGAGTAQYPGALYVDCDDAKNGYNIYNLTGDAVIYGSLPEVHFTGNGRDGQTVNVWKMDGKRLTLRSSLDDAVFIFYMATSFESPGEIVLDGVSLSHNSGSIFSVVGTPRKIPVVKLINGASLALTSVEMAEAIQSVDCEIGTKLRQVVYGTGAQPVVDVEIDTLVGCPAISNSTISVRHLIVRASDAAEGGKVTGKFKMANGAFLEIDGSGSQLSSCAWPLPVAESEVMIGDAPSTPNLTSAQVLNERTLMAGMIRDLSGAFVVNVLRDKTMNWEKAKLGVEDEDIRGKRFLKIGQGVFNPQADIYLAGMIDAEIADGEYQLWSTNGVPAVAEDGSRPIKVCQGASLSVKFDLAQFKDRWSMLKLNLAGEGTPTCPGALHLDAACTKSSSQCIVYELSDDAVIYNAENVYLLSRYNTATDSNKFLMNGHNLVFRSSSPDKVVNFRFYVNVNNPGSIIVDNDSLFFNGNLQLTGTPSDIPAVVLKNGARCDFYDENDSSKIAEIQCETGTSFANLDGRSGSIAYEIRKLTGFPLVSSGITVNVGALLACAEDLRSGRYLDCLGEIVFGANSTFSIDDLQWRPDDEKTYFVRGGIGKIIGKPKVNGDLGRARLETDGGYDWLCLRKSGLVLIFR